MKLLVMQKILHRFFLFFSINLFNSSAVAFALVSLKFLLIVIISFIIMGVVYALFSDRIELTNKLKIGSVKIDDLNLTLKKENGDLEDVIEPADLDTISWTTKNLGTSGVLTRHVLEIYWQEATDIDSSELMFLYPANISRQAVIADFNKIKNGGTSDYGLNTEPISKTVAAGQDEYDSYDAWIVVGKDDALHD